MPAMQRSSCSRGSLQLLVAALALCAASFSSTAWAKKKAKEDAPAPAAAAPTGPIAPEPDSMGRVHFGPQSGEGLGRVTVRGAASDKIQVWLEGRYFGDAPLTIYSVPKGDYIIEGKYPDGKEVSRPVSVGENEEALVELAAGKGPGAPGAPKEGFLSGEISPQRLLVTKVLLGAAAASLVVGVVFGVLELNAQHDYEKTPASDQAALDSITSRGKRDALIANIGYIAMIPLLAGAALAGYPMVLKPNPEKSETTALTVTPLVGRGAAGGSLTLRF
jgi:hypothetical protein